jgi:hypothetical protein
LVKIIKVREWGGDKEYTSTIWRGNRREGINFKKGIWTRDLYKLQLKEVDLVNKAWTHPAEGSVQWRALKYIGI